MKKLITIVALTALFSGFAMVDDAAAGKSKNQYGSKYKYKYKYKNKFGSKFGGGKHNGGGNFYAPYRAKVKFKLPFGGVIVAPAPFPAPPIFHAPPPVVPAFTYVYEQVWIEPVFTQVISGYDHHGNPIFQQVISDQGHYQTAKYQLFPSGRKIFVGYV